MTISEEDGFVLDASVLVELVGDGRHRVAADALLDRIEGDGEPVLITAAHGLVEAIHAYRRLEAQGEVDPRSAGLAVRDLGRLPLLVDPAGPRRERIWSLRRTMTAYDAAYAAAAEALNAPLLTVDVRLLRACASAGIPAAHLDDLAA
ncbi:MAG: PIN domain-containing protein [Thermoleophilia bacterium]